MTPATTIAVSPLREHVALYTLPTCTERAFISSGALAASVQPLPAGSLVAVMGWAAPADGLATFARRIGVAVNGITWLPGIALGGSAPLIGRGARLRHWLRTGEFDLLRNRQYAAELRAGNSLLVVHGISRDAALGLRERLVGAGALNLHYHGRFTVAHLGLAQQVARASRGSQRPLSPRSATAGTIVHRCRTTPGEMTDQLLVRLRRSVALVAPR